MTEASIRVALLGTGAMGEEIARLVMAKRGLALVGAHARRAARAGLDLGTTFGWEREAGVAISTDLAELVDRTRPAIALQATCSTLTDAWEEIEVLVRRRVRVVSIAEELAFPWARWPGRARALDALAREHGVAVLGTGVNPGFVLDLLVVALSGVCHAIQSIRATRVNDLSPYGPTVLRSQGVGLSPAEFRAGVERGEVVGHVGFPESIAMIAAALGWQMSEVRETREPIVSSVARHTPFVAIRPGDVAGCLHSATAVRRDGEGRIELIHPQQIVPQAEGVSTRDEIVIEGTPRVALSGSPEIPGGIATTALAVNLIPHVLAAQPGLVSAIDLPVPAALLGDARRAVERLRRGALGVGGSRGS
ncbi:MAG: 2,4-diaminopentanoate dehydrogenase [bacterium]